jgi:putative membrane protein
MKYTHSTIHVRSLCLIALTVGAHALSAQSPAMSSDRDDAASTPAYDSHTPTMTTGKLKWSDKHFVTKVAEGGQIEIALAELAVERASNADVRSYAQQLVNDHRQMSHQLERLAQSKGLQSEIAEYRPRGGRANDRANDTNVAGAPTGRTNDEIASTNWNDPTTDRHYKRLAGKSGADFDKAFIAVMVSDHEDHVSLFEKKAQNADDPDVRSFASDNLPKLKAHLEHAQQLSATFESLR